MFTGIIEELGKLITIKKSTTSALLTITADKVLDGTKVGDSIAVNGVCLTVTTLANRIFTADVMLETLTHTALADLKTGDAVNLERAMQLGGRLGGHLVSGHVDGVGTIRSQKTIDIAVLTEISAPQELISFILPKGSVAIDGISLTVVDTGKDYFSVSLIPLTAKDTTIGYKKTGMKVNLETDMLGKYIYRFMQNMNLKDNKKSALNVNFLTEHGFM